MQDIFSMQQVPIRQRVRRIIRGLKAPKDSGDHKYAMMAMQRIFGPSTSSLAVGILVIVALSTIATTTLTQNRSVEVTIMDPEIVKIEEIKQIEQEIQPEPEIEQPDMDVNMAEDVSVAQPSEVGIGMENVDDSPLVALAPVLTKSPLIMRGLYGNRTKGGRSAALRTYRAPSGVEDAVLRALRWLKKKQQEDGSWPGHAGANTGFALLCFLAHGETPASAEFGQTVQKGLQFLMSRQGADGSFDANGYANGIATYAMCEAYAMTKILALKDAAEKSIGRVVTGQQAGGGYNYNYQMGPRWDTSVAGWQMQALKAAKMAGLESAGVDQAIDKARQWLKNNSFNPQNGGFSYSANGNEVGPGGSWTMTGVGVLCLQFYGCAKDVETRAGLKFLENQVFNWDKGSDEKEKDGKPAAGRGSNSVYGWYYVTQAKFQEGGATWDSWNRQFAIALINGQFDDGHWTNGDWGGSAGSPEVYTTCLACLMLEVYYRYLPTFQKQEEAAPVNAGSSDDVVVKVSG